MDSRKTVAAGDGLHGTQGEECGMARPLECALSDAAADRFDAWARRCQPHLLDAEADSVAAATLFAAREGWREAAAELEQSLQEALTWKAAVLREVQGRLGLEAAQRLHDMPHAAVAALASAELPEAASAAHHDVPLPPPEVEHHGRRFHSEAQVRDHAREQTRAALHALRREMLDAQRPMSAIWRGLRVVPEQPDRRMLNSALEIEIGQKDWMALRIKKAVQAAPALPDDALKPVVWLLVDAQGAPLRRADGTLRTLEAPACGDSAGHAAGANTVPLYWVPPAVIPRQADVDKVMSLIDDYARERADHLRMPGCHRCDHAGASLCEPVVQQREVVHAAVAQLVAMQRWDARDTSPAKAFAVFPDVAGTDQAMLLAQHNGFAYVSSQGRHLSKEENRLEGIAAEFLSLAQLEQRLNAGRPLGAHAFHRVRLAAEEAMQQAWLRNPKALGNARALFENALKRTCGLADDWTYQAAESA